MSWPVSEVSEQEVSRLPQYDLSKRHKRFDLLTCEQPHISLQAHWWLLAPERNPAHQPLLQRCVQLLEELQPRQEICQRVEQVYHAAFRTRMIGVHLRRGDYQVYNAKTAGTTYIALEAVDAFLTSCPDFGILLCTDDGAIDPETGRVLPGEGVRAKFLARYGNRVVSSAPRSLDRRDPVAIQDAVVDLLLLRKTDCFVGTQYSSFSALATFGRDVPVIWCRSTNPFLHLRPLWLWITRAEPFRRVIPYYVDMIRRWL